MIRSEVQCSEVQFNASLAAHTISRGRGTGNSIVCETPNGTTIGITITILAGTAVLHLLPCVTLTTLLLPTLLSCAMSSFSLITSLLPSVLLLLLLTPNRYYSNAFTDMVKQDAMNVFLGFYIPQEMTVPLWDLDSDYYLHNRSYKPPTPHINRILFDEHRLSGNSAGAYSRDYMLLGGMEGTDRERERERERDRDGSSRVMQEEVARKYFINTHAMQNQRVLRIGDSEANGTLTVTEGREGKEKEREMEDTKAQGYGVNSGGGKHLAMQR
jgi:hypothetical protein